MKGIDQDLKNDVNETRKKEQERKLTFSHSFLPNKGHKIWKYNTSDRTLIEHRFEATKESKEITWNQATSSSKMIAQNKKIELEENCIYFNALNWKNAVKRLKRDYKIIL